MSRTSTISLWTSRLYRKKSQWAVDEALLRSLTPLNLLDAGELKGLIPRSSVHSVDAGQEICARRDKSRSTVYLLSGTAEFISHNEVVSVVAAGTDASKHPLLKPRTRGVAVKAKVDCTVLELEVDSDELLERLNGSSDYQVSDIRSATDTDWLTRFIQAKVFMRLPASNIRELLSRMEEIPVTAGQVIMRQGESDDYYYIVKEGRCRVTTKAPSGKGVVEVAELREGDGFGEDALITNGRRGATVTMVNDGSLMRLSKEAFTSLLVAPVLKYVTWEQAQGLMQDGAVLLDVRRPEEFGSDGLDGAVNIPLNVLRSRAHELDTRRPHITVSNVLNRSSAAAFFLCQQGMDACILKEGTRVPVAARLRPIQKHKKHDAPPQPTAQVTPIRAKAVSKKGSSDAELQKSLDAVRHDLTREREHKRHIEDQLGQQHNELRRLRRAREVDTAAGSKPAATKETLGMTALREQDLEKRLADLERSLAHERSAKQSAEREMDELRERLQRLHQTREVDSELKAQLESAIQALARERGQRNTMGQILAQRDKDLQRFQHVLEADDELRSDLSSVKRALVRESEARQDAEARLAACKDELRQLHQLQQADAGLKADLAATRRRLDQERELNKVIENQLERQHTELQRLQEEGRVGGALAAELAAAKEQLAREKAHKEEVLHKADTQNQSMRRLEQQLNKFRHRLKKVVTLARTAEKKRLDAEKQRHAAEQQAEAAELNLKTVRQDIEDRSLRLAEVELERRKLERTVAELSAQQPRARKAAVFQAADADGAAPQSAAIRVNQITDRAADEGRMALRLPLLQDDADTTPRGSNTRRLQRFVTRALIWIILIGVALLSLYGVAFTGAFKVKAASRQGAGSAHSGAISSFPSLPLKLPFVSGHAETAGGGVAPANNNK